jgi:hypothetical protein
MKVKFRYLSVTTEKKQANISPNSRYSGSECNEVPPE